MGITLNRRLICKNTYHNNGKSHCDNYKGHNYISYSKKTKHMLKKVLRIFKTLLVLKLFSFLLLQFAASFPRIIFFSNICHYNSWLYSVQHRVIQKDWSRYLGQKKSQRSNSPMKIKMNLQITRKMARISEAPMRRECVF